MKNSTILILGALIAGVVLVYRRGFAGQGGGRVTTLTNVLSGTQVTLGNGNVYDTGNGVIFDPMTGNYTDISTGRIIYKGAGT